MSTNSRNAITTVQGILEYVSSFVGGAIPDTDTDEYAEIIRWIQLGQQDMANRGFWRRLLTKADLSIVTDAETTNLPDNFYKVNGIYALFVDDVDWNEAGNEDEIRIFVETNPTTGAWRIRWLPDPPTASSTGELWYFYNPPIIAEAADYIILDGEAIGFYVLKEYYRKLKQFGSLDDARIEYENRVNNLLSLEMLPSKQELSSFKSFQSQRGLRTIGRANYVSRGNRSRHF